jgi:hypothetical protein
MSISSSSPESQPSREAIAKAYQEGGCDVCGGPPDAFADRVVGGCDITALDRRDTRNPPSSPPSWLMKFTVEGHVGPDHECRCRDAGWTVASLAGCSRCRTVWAYQVRHHLEPRADMPAQWFEPSPLDDWRNVSGNGVPRFLSDWQEGPEGQGFLATDPGGTRRTAL